MDVNQDRMSEDNYYNDGTESKVFCSTSAGDFVMKLNRGWSPRGYDRAVELFERGFYDNSHFFRVVPKFLVQFGISYTTDQDLKSFADSTIMDDPQLTPPIKFDEGVISFAGSGPNSRTSHLFIAYGPVPSLGTQLWETPIGTVIEGMEVVRSLNSEYGDMPPWGHGPEQHKIRRGGLAYMEAEFPNLDKFIHCRVQRMEEEIRDDHKQYDEGLKQGMSLSHEKHETQEETGTIREGFHHIAFPLVAAIAVFFVLTCLTRRGRRKIMDKNV